MQKERLRPENVMALMQQKGKTISLEEAILILSILKKLANIAVSHYLK